MENENSEMAEAVHEKGATRLKEFFLEMPNRVSLILFTKPGKTEPFNRAAREVIGSFGKMSPRIEVQEFGMDHPEAKRLNVTASPTLLFNPDRLKIRWLGSPVGEEARTLVEAISMIGYGRIGLSEESAKILSRLDSSRQIKLFVSPTCPYCPQQAINAFRAALAKPDLVSLEIVDIQANPELAAQYSAQSVPQAFANEKLIALGAQPEELFMASLEKMEEQSYFIPESDAARVETDLVIVGGGPAGLTAGIYAARSGIKSVIIERGILGGQIATTPLIENYPGLTQIGGKTLVDIMVSHALEYANIFPGEEVMEILPGDTIEVVTNRRRYFTRAVLLATGASHRRLGVPGEARFAGNGVSYCSTCDGPLFKGKRVVMVGGGNSAVTESLYLFNIGVNVTLVHRRDALRAQAYLLKGLSDSRIPVLLNTEVQEITGSNAVEEVTLLDSKTGKKDHLRVDGVFVAIGYEPNTQLARKIGIEIGSDGYILHDERHRTNIRGIYSAGDVEGGYKQIVIAAGKGSEAALAIFEDLINPYWKK